MCSSDLALLRLESSCAPPAGNRYALEVAQPNQSADGRSYFDAAVEESPRYFWLRKPIGYSQLMEVSAAEAGHGDAAWFGVAPGPDFWIGRGSPNVPPVHVAFRVSSRAQVGVLTIPNYYGAFVLDCRRP